MFGHAKNSEHQRTINEFSNFIMLRHLPFLGQDLHEVVDNDIESEPDDEQVSVFLGKGQKSLLLQHS